MSAAMGPDLTPASHGPRALLELSQAETALPLTIIAAGLGITTGIVTFPAARLSDRVGRGNDSI